MNKIITGDSLEELRELEQCVIDSIIIDPPYFQVLKDEWDNQWKTEQDYLEWIEKHIIELFRVLKPTGTIMMFTGRQYNRYISLMLDKYFTEQRIIIWKRKRNKSTTRGKSLASGYEPICYYTKSDKFTYNNIKIQPELHLRNRKEYKKGGMLEQGVALSDVWIDIPALSHNSKERVKHPSQKPKALINRMIEMTTNENDVVLDCFGGSGTTAIACIELNRQYILIEREQDYIDITNERLNI